MVGEEHETPSPGLNRYIATLLDLETQLHTSLGSICSGEALSVRGRGQPPCPYNARVRPSIARFRCPMIALLLIDNLPFILPIGMTVPRSYQDGWCGRIPIFNMKIGIQLGGDRKRQGAASARSPRFGELPPSGGLRFSI
jgi:hypothetical protein